MTKVTLSSVTNIGGNPTSAGATINANSALITTAIEKTLSRDGTSPNQMDATLDMNDNRIINLPNATSDTEPLTRGQVTAEGSTVIINGLDVDHRSGTFTFTGDGTTTAFNINAQTGVSAISDTHLVLWFEDGVVQRQGTDYTVSGSTITRTTAPEDDAIVFGYVFGPEVS